MSEAETQGLRKIVDATLDDIDGLGLAIAGCESVQELEETASAWFHAVAKRAEGATCELCGQRTDALCERLPDGRVVHGTCYEQAAGQ